jgi:hypothetical protein
MPDLDDYRIGHAYEGRWGAEADCGWTWPCRVNHSYRLAQLALTEHVRLAHPLAWELAAQVYAHAEAHYNDGGWDVVVECWSREAIAEALVWYGPRDSEPRPCTTLDEAIRKSVLAQCVGVWADHEADAINSAF